MSLDNTLKYINAQHQFSQWHFLALRFKTHKLNFLNFVTRKSVLNFRSLQKNILELKENSIQRQRILENFNRDIWRKKINCRLSTDERMKLKWASKKQAVRVRKQTGEGLSLWYLSRQKLMRSQFLAKVGNFYSPIQILKKEIFVTWKCQKHTKHF